MTHRLLGLDIEKSDLFKWLFDQLEGVVVSDAEGRYVYVNQSWTNMFGPTLDEVRGRFIHDVVPETSFDEALRTGQPIRNVPLRITNGSGGSIRIICSYIPLVDGDRLVGCLCYVFMRNIKEVMELTARTIDLMSELRLAQKELAEYRGARYSIANIIGNSKAILKLKTAVLQAGRSPSTVLVEGETGTGKELVAHSIHALSNRTSNSFIKVNCAAIPPELMESEFFGYEGGAFTGAHKSGKKGKFELAHRGTLFLDEINHLPFSMQPKLLRVLQEREFERVGGGESVRVDVRIVAATNVPLVELVNSASFREDLFYRLNVIGIRVPPLREHKDDIPRLAENLLERLNFQTGMKVPGISDEAKQRLKNYDWPGNVREMQNVIERAMNNAWLETLTWKHFEEYFQDRRCGGEQKPVVSDRPIRERKKALEKEAIRDALTAVGGNKRQAAMALGISRVLLYKKMKEYDL